ncbi:MAG: hypothetical protein AMXMBFR59_38850 [Rhodanobacteraceae bacterium]
MIGKWAGFALMLAALTLAAPLVASEKQVAGEATEPAATAKQTAAIEMYVMPDCGYCKKARELLTARGVSWTEHDIVSSAEAKRAFDAKGGRGTPLLIVGGDVIQGVDAERIDAALREHGIVAR